MDASAEALLTVGVVQVGMPFSPLAVHQPFPAAAGIVLMCIGGTMQFAVILADWVTHRRARS